MSWPSTRALTLGNALTASTVALTKNDMKPRATPCFFWNDSLYFERRSITRVMSASLKVVRIAAVCWTSTRRWAIFWRMPLILWRDSRGGAECGVLGAEGFGAGVEGRAGGDGAAIAGEGAAT